ncbi:hypothetical protein BOX15_Mlig015700g1 [Macrostomum lignano]|uniref:Uncharacterized protein n=1 Tax=Macrostomum lignano TaxID=282301 RepID=A0A267F7T5_9PLAT|nr:hypothetical protein BOX15_Mlig015700g1 [Macrostomum lignano]
MKSITEQFWYLRIKITQLLSGQKLHIVNTETSDIPKEVDNDQMYDLSDTSHTYPAILYMKYLYYVVFYWEDARVSGQENHVNITVSTYAKFNDTVNNTMQMDLCNHYGNTWCSKPLASICMGPNSCSLQDDCFDLFSEPSRCSDFPWFRNAGPVTSVNRSLSVTQSGNRSLADTQSGNRSLSVTQSVIRSLSDTQSVNRSLTIAGSSLRSTGWILSNLPWFTLSSVSLVLVMA